MSTPKPGNVSKLHDFPETTYYHFLASSTAIHGPMHDLAEMPEFTIGEGILDAVMASHASQKGGNTHLGTILLFAPLAKAAGTVKGDVTVTKLRNAIIKVLDDAGFEDTVNAYDAINYAPVGGLNPVPRLDVREPATLEQIKERAIVLRDWMAVGSKVNSISYEYETYYRLTFEIGVPVLLKSVEMDLEKAILHTFITLLSRREDSHVMGQFGKGVSKDITEEARAIIDAGSVWERKGLGLIDDLGARLRGKEVNPGTTADLTATALFVALMAGLTY